jgi:hypothetical protein
MVERWPCWLVAGNHGVVFSGAKRQKAQFPRGCGETFCGSDLQEFRKNPCAVGCPEQGVVLSTVATIDCLKPRIVIPNAVRNRPAQPV